jgi:predicted pyridoxine 5'-phosphate oxidase superfamily flavin-nucleotide-binding protein
MEKVNPEMREIIEEQKLCYVATASSEGRPNVSPKGSIICVDGDTLAFAAVRSEKTLKNLAENPAVSVAVLDVAQRKGYQFKGQATMISEGEIYCQVVDPLKKRLPNLPPVQAVIVIKVEEVHSF